MKDSAQGKTYKSGGAEQMAAFRQVDCAKLAGPRVHVLKNSFVDGLDMGDVESPLYGSMDQLNDAMRRGLCLETAQSAGITNVAKVFKDGRPGIEVQVRTLGYAAP